MKKFRICLAGILAMAMILAGCGSTATPSTPEEGLTGKEDIAIKGDVNVDANVDSSDEDVASDDASSEESTAEDSSSKNKDSSSKDKDSSSKNKDSSSKDKDSSSKDKDSSSKDKDSSSKDKDSSSKVESTPSKDNNTSSKVESTPSKNNSSSSKDNNTASKGEALGEVEIKDVETKDYTVKAKGSKYAEGIMLPKLSKEQAKISYMTNTTWEYIQQESTETSPTAIYHAMKIWKETYGVDVEIEMVDWGSFTNHLITSVVAGDSPEVMRFIDGRPKWIANGLVTSLDDKLDLTDKDYDVEQMQSSSALYGHLYAAYGQGMKTPTNVVAYNKTKFQEAGETDPMTLYKQGKWNFTQFIKTAKNMTDAANDEYGLAGTGSLFPSAFTIMYLNDDATVSLNIKNPSFVKCMQAVWKLYRVENAARRTDDMRSTFPLGKDAMAMTSGKDYCRMMDTAKSNGTTDEFGIVPYPAYDMVDETNPRGSNSFHLEGFSISAAPQNMEGAVEFVRLVSKVATNISEDLSDWGWAGNYMTKEEKEVFGKVKYAKVEHSDCTNSIDGTNGPVNEYFKYPIYLNANTTKDLSSILASAQSAFEGVIAEYEINAGLRS